MSPQAAHVLKHPAAFALQVLKAFQANQGLLLAGAVAYYALLSIVPLLILMVMALSHLIDQAELLATLRRALEHVVPGQGKAVVVELAAFLKQGTAIGWVLLGTMLFFSSLAFKVLENAMSVIFLHRVTKRKRHFLVSAFLPFAYIAFIGAALFVTTVVLARVVAIGEGELVILGNYSWSLGGFSRFFLYIAGVFAETLVFSSIYYFMPVGRISPSHALIGGASAAVLWEIIRHGLVWYFTTLSGVNVLYGSLATAILVLLSLEIAATLLLFGAQVIAEYEGIGESPADAPPVAMRTEAVPPASSDEVKK